MAIPIGYGRYIGLAKRYIASGKLPALLLSVSRKSERKKLANGDLKLFQQLVKAWITGKYSGLSRQALISVVAALIYFLSPIDLIPDFILGLGLVDDLAVIAWVMNSWRGELDLFRQWQQAQQTGGTDLSDPSAESKIS